MVNDTLSLDAPESFSCIVEIPKGSRNKYEFDHERHVIRLDRFLFVSVVYPTVYKQLENKHVDIEGWYSREDAIREIEASRARYRDEDSH